MTTRSLLAAAIAQLLTVPALHAATITVNSTADGSPADDGACTLREAIASANTGAASGAMGGECAAGDSGADAIEFDATVFNAPQVITLTEGELAITAPVTVTGPGRDQLTIDASAASRHFAIDDGDTGVAIDVALSDLTLVNGAVTDASGGAIDARENLSLFRATLSGNTVLGGGVNPALGAGGALNVDGSGQPGLAVTLDDVRLENNQARIGGGLSLRLSFTTTPSTVTIENSLIDGNRARPSGPISPGRGGGGIDLGGEASLVLRDSTISNNNADGTNTSRVGGLAISAGAGSDLLIERVQVQNNTAGVSNDGDVGGLHLSLDSPLCIAAKSMNPQRHDRAKGGYSCTAPAPASSMQLLDSTIAGNVAYAGSVGGLSFAADGVGTFTIERTTISGNVAGNNRGGAYLDALGATIQVFNSTISGNRADRRAGGIDAYVYYGNGFAGTYLGRIEILQSTIVGNTADADMDGDGLGGGIYLNSSSNGTVTLTRSILAGNADNSLLPQPDLATNGETISFFNSLVGDNTGTSLSGAPVGSPDGDGNLIGDPAGAGVIAPLLDALADNGGLTETHLPQIGSPVIDAAGACIGTDQRGETRPQGAACDMGAVEVVASETPQVGPDFTVNATDDAGDGVCGVSIGECTLRDAVIAANADPGASVIDFDAATFPPQAKGAISAITLTQGELPIISTVTVDGPGRGSLSILRDSATPCTLDDVAQAGEFRLLRVSGSGNALSLSSMTLSGGCADGTTPGQQHGGAIYSEGASLTLTDVVLSGNTANAGGGGLSFVAEGTRALTITDSDIVSNEAGGDGGGIRSSGTAPATVTGSTISANTAGADGGALTALAGSALVVRDSGLLQNTAGEDGGAISLTSASLTLERSTLFENTATGFGGGVVTSGAATVVVRHSTISANTAGVNGGGLYVDSTESVSLEDTTFFGNQAQLGKSVGGNASITASRSIFAGAGAPHCYVTPPIGIGSSDNLTTDTSSCGPAFTTVTLPDLNLGAATTFGGQGRVHIPGPGSVAVDAAAGCTGADQRGTAVPIDADGVAGDDCDIGAVEVQNTVPVAPDEGATTGENTPVTGTVLANVTDADDEDAGVITVTAVDGSPGNLGQDVSPGTSVLLVNGDGSFSFDPANEFEALQMGESADVAVSYTISDGFAAVDATLTVTINGVNDAPVAGTTAATTDEDNAVTVAFAAADPEDDALSFAITAQPARGSVSENGDGSFTFDPAGAFEGLDDGESEQVTFSYEVSDGALTDTAVQTVTINGVNDAPVAGTTAATTDEDNAVTVAFAAADPEDDALSFAITAQPARGSVSENGDGSFTFDPAGAFEGLDDGESEQVTFSYEVSDGALTDTAVQTVTINGVNDAPVAGTTAATTDEDNAVTVAFAAADPEDDALSFAITAQPARGSVSENGDGSFTFDPAGAFEGLDDGESEQVTFSYEVSDGALTDTAVQTVTINGVNDAPVAQDDDTTAAAGTVLNVGAASGLLANDFDADGETLTVTTTGVTTPTGGGSLTINADGSFEFDPSGATAATLAADYTITDGDLTASATLTIAITGLDTVDLAIAKVADQTIVGPGDVLTYTISVMNNGPADAAGARVEDTLPAVLLGASWICTPVGGASCTASGVGDIDELIDIPAGDAVEFTLTARIDPGAPEADVTNTASVAAPGGLQELAPADNTASVKTSTDLVFGDSFEAAPVVRTFSARTAQLSGKALETLPGDGTPRLVIRAQDSGAKELALVLVHARQRGLTRELRITRYEAGRLQVGNWTAVTGANVEVRW